MKENYRSSGFNDAPGYRSIRSIANLTGKSHFDIEFFDTKRFSCQPTWTTNLSVSMKGEIPLQLLPGKNNKQPLMSGLIPMMIHFAPPRTTRGDPKDPTFLRTKISDDHRKIWSRPPWSSKYGSFSVTNLQRSESLQGQTLGRTGENATLGAVSDEHTWLTRCIDVTRVLPICHIQYPMSFDAHHCLKGCRSSVSWVQPAGARDHWDLLRNHDKETLEPSWLQVWHDQSSQSPSLQGSFTAKINKCYVQSLV